MEHSRLPRVPWRENSDAVELGFDFYLQLLERRLRGERVSLVQGLRQFYQQKLGIDLRETQARGLMHRTSSVFIDYVNEVIAETFLPNVEHWQEQGLQSFFDWRERFYQARNAVAADVDEELLELLERRPAERSGPARRQQVVIPRIIRDSALGRFLKSLYQSRCQICSFSSRLPRGTRYAECHHLRPLGQPHGGPDIQTNMIVLCPNHHAMIDYGVIAIHPDEMTVQSIEHNLPEHHKSLDARRHPLGSEFLEYHYTNIFHPTP